MAKDTTPACVDMSDLALSESALILISAILATWSSTWRFAVHAELCAAMVMQLLVPKLIGLKLRWVGLHKLKSHFCPPYSYS